MKYFSTVNKFVNDFKERGYEINPLTLNFKWSIEKNYENYSISEFLPVIRFFLVMAIFFYSIFGLIEPIILPTQYKFILILRFAFFIPLLIAVWGFTFSKYFNEVSQLTLSTVFGIGGFFNLIMTIVVPKDLELHYLIGLILILFFGYTFVKLKFIYASITGTLVSLGYISIILFTDNYTMDMAIRNIVILFTANSLGMLANYFIELTDRRNFVSFLQLGIEKNRINALYQEQELVVTSRTEQLNKTIELLNSEIKVRKEAQEQVLSNSILLKSIIDNSQDIIFLTSNDWKIAFFNLNFSKFFPNVVPEDHIDSLHNYSVIYNGDQFPLSRLLKRYHSGIEVEHINEDGNVLNWLIINDRIRIGTEKEFILMRIIDITQFKLASIELVKQKEIFKGIFEFSPNATLITKLSDSTIINVNSAFEKLSGYSKDELIGRSIANLGLWFKSYDNEYVEKLLNSTGFLNNLNISLKCKSGENLSTLCSSKVLDLNGEQCSMSIITDISKLEKAQYELEKSEKKFKSMFNNSLIGLFSLNVQKGKITNANETSANILGYYDSFDLIENFKLDLHFYDINQWDSIQKGIINSGTIENYSLKLRTKDDRKIWTNFFARLNDNDFNLDCAIIDVTVEKNLAEKLQKSHIQYQTVFNEAPFALGIIDGSGGLIECNESFKKLLGEEIPNFNFNSDNNISTNPFKKVILNFIDSSFKHSSEKPLVFKREFELNIIGIPKIYSVDIVPLKQDDYSNIQFLILANECFVSNQLIDKAHIDESTVLDNDSILSELSADFNFNNAIERKVEDIGYDLLTQQLDYLKSRINCAIESNRILSDNMNEASSEIKSIISHLIAATTQLDKYLISDDKSKEQSMKIRDGIAKLKFILEKLITDIKKNIFEFEQS